jgi:hypothetical protein
MADEAKSQLQIHGSFGIDSGTVSIEDTTLAIISWSDSLILASLPDSGKGAGGNVIVQTLKGVSNKRVLSIIFMHIDYSKFVLESGNYWKMISDNSWHCNWRTDIGPRQADLNSPFLFEISKSSYGDYFDYQGNYNKAAIPWADSSLLHDTCISVSGLMDLSAHEINLKKIYMTYGNANKFFDRPKILKFDSLGFLDAALDTIYDNDLGYHRNVYSYGGLILFPPATKNTVSQPSESNFEHINIIANDHSITLRTPSVLGPTTASLYSIDGRLLQRTKLNIPSAGIYTLDASDVHAHFALLVLQTERGVITRKILF